MALVRGVIAASINVSSRFNVSGLISTNTGTARRSTTALAVETKVKDGMITSSPGSSSQRMAAISNADVHDWVSKASITLRRSFNQAWHRSANLPLPEKLRSRNTSVRYSISRPATGGTLNGTRIIRQARQQHVDAAGRRLSQARPVHLPVV